MINKQKKQEIIKELADKFSRQEAVVFSDYTGLKVSQFEELRHQLREQELDCQVAKKSLIDLALKKAGFKNIQAKSLTGQMFLVFGYQDEILPAKILYAFAKNNQSLKILAGLIQGEYLTGQTLIELAQLPSRQELLAQLISRLSAPLLGLINVFKGNIKRLIFILKSSNI